MPDWYVNPPGGLSYGAARPPDISRNLMVGLPGLVDAYREGQMRQPVIDPNTGQPVSLNDPQAFEKIAQEGLRRGGLPYAQGILPYLWKQQLLREGGAPVDPDLVGGGPAEPTPGPGASAKPAPGAPATTTLASLGAYYAKSGILSGDDVGKAIISASVALGVPRDKPLEPDQIEQASRLMTGGGRQAAASPISPPSTEGETARGPASAADARDAGATGSPGVMPARQPVETATPALASAGIQPTTPPTTARAPAPNNPAGAGPQHIVAGQLPPDVARAYAQAGPAPPGQLPPGGVGGVSPASTLVPPKYIGHENEYVAKLRAQALRDRNAANRQSMIGIQNKALEDRAASWDAQATKIQEQMASAAAERDKLAGAYYQKLYTGLQSAGNTGASSMEQIEGTISALNTPGIYTGWGAPVVNVLKSFLAGTGLDPNAALAPDVFSKTMAAFMLNQTNTLRDDAIASGATTMRIFSQQIDTMMKAAPDGGKSLAGNRYLVEVYRRAALRSQQIADMAANYKGGLLDSRFEIDTRKWMQEHPMFTKTELAHPEMIAAPTFYTADDVHAAVADGSIKVGDPIKMPTVGGDYRIVHAK